MQYDKVEISDWKKENQEWYLYRKDTSNKATGLFLTGEIREKYIKKVKNILKKDSRSINGPEIEDFIIQKIFSFRKSKLINDKNLMDTLSQDRKREIEGIIKKLTSETKQGRKLSREVINEINAHESKTMLITMMIRESSNSQPKYIGQIKEYVDLFVKGVYKKRTYSKNEKKLKPQKAHRSKNSVSIEKTNEEHLVCTVCNKLKLIGVFHESPLPFYFTKKSLFFPDADTEQVRKGFPVCDNCYFDLQKGIKFIKDNLRYRIPFKGSELNFWLLPHISNKQSIISLKDQLRNKNLSLNLLKELCSTLKAISMHDVRQIKDIKSFLSFSALFYTLNGWMRVITHIQGIYPSQLKRLFDAKEIVERKYPYRLLSNRYDDRSAFFVGFPLLIMFYKDERLSLGKREKANKKDWQKQVIIILEKMFTGKQIPLQEIVRQINMKTRSLMLKSFDLMSISKTAFMGMLLLEYLISLNEIQNNKVSKSEEGEGRGVEDDQAQLFTGITRHIQRFIDNHDNLLIDGNTRAIFATGVCVGILLEVQNERYKKIAPFWNRLNRLNMDIQRIKEFPCEVKSKLVFYNIRDYDPIISYLQAHEIIKLDIKVSDSTINKEDLNLIFTIGISYGYLLKNDVDRLNNTTNIHKRREDR